MMMSIDRRGFLQGVFGGVTAAGLIVVAKPEEIQAFSSSLLRDSPVFVDRHVLKSASIGEHLYNEHGECVAIVREMASSFRPIDVTSAWDNQKVYMPDRQHVTLMADVIGTVELQGESFPRLRGRMRNV